MTMAYKHGTSPTCSSDFWTSSDPLKFQVANAIPEHECRCIEVKTVSTTRLQMATITTKSAFCALHGLLEMSAIVNVWTPLQ